MTDDIRGLLMSLQNDYSQKLENIDKYLYKSIFLNRLEGKVTELVNRVIMEHEERIRLHVKFH